MKINSDHKPHVKLTAGVLVLICMLLYGCKEKFLPEIKENNVNYLVIEGLINTGNDSTIFTLTRTFKLNNKAVEVGEKAAIVQVESEAGTTYVLPALVKAGRYGRPSLGLDPTKKYRLRIRTTDQREYLSNFVESRTSQPMDELKYDFKNEHLNVYAYSRDPSGNSRYYRYNYIETIEYTSSLVSYYKVASNKVVDRIQPDDMIWRCYRPILSNTIVLASTAALEKDEVADVYIVSVPRGSFKIRLGYSIAVRQHVLTKEGFDFYEALKKNTESIGSIFDAQPSQLFGNIRSITDPSEVVIGFISAGTFTEKRVTFTSADFPNEWFKPREIDSLCLATVKPMSAAAIVAQHPVWVPLDIALGGTGAYNASNNLDCVDCRRQGGTNIKPPYWK
jgi:hypothetical protein